MRKSMCLLLVLLLLTSCGIVSKETSPSPQDKPASQTAQSHQGNHGVQQLADDPNGTTLPETARADGQPLDGNNTSEVALKDHLEQLAKRVPGVNGAHCVVMGNTAIIGIDVNAALDRSRVGTIKYSVAEAVRKDPRKINALVTADMDLSGRLADMSRHVSNGNPVSGFAAEMADIIGRIMPQFPEDTQPQGNGNGQ
ncbi:YhcN/YlaJ family sporulation lipoprotein [Paenibacillus albidus]|uniref:YhcN/YlaJ family sporulation lipoprotein n=1 Tax=Paenibacillus albidus TaxID=2041023 RepID=UPI001BE84EDA|nr:YhcN/YlaJ family sporulation lipoprotein [Paenibacillus albidus]MBT2288085.1 YhcN/YlaJ family sporulation lipoprotein [Paenibacillus albidus]